MSAIKFGKIVVEMPNRMVFETAKGKFTNKSNIVNNNKPIKIKGQPAFNIITSNVKKPIILNDGVIYLKKEKYLNKQVNKYIFKAKVKLVQ